MNLINHHNPNCNNVVWQLEWRFTKGYKEYRATCRGCGATTPVTETEAEAWEKASQSDDKMLLVKVEPPTDEV